MIGLMYIFLVNFLYAGDFERNWEEVDCPTDLSIYAKEAVNIWLSGVGIPNENNSCLKRMQNTSIFSWDTEVHSESPSTIKNIIKIDEKAKVDIFKIEVMPDSAGEYQITFSVNGEKHNMGIILYRLNGGVSLKSDAPCAQISFPRPFKVYKRNECKIIE